MGSVEAQRVGQIEGEGSDEVALPVVIRPQRLLFGDVEAKLRQDRSFRRCLRELPAACAAVARAVMLRDRSARLRFGNFRELAAYLRVLAGKHPIEPAQGSGLAG